MLSGVRRYVLGTAGHVDHGKTTLVRALTGVDTTRLPEEKRRGITIELGFAPWSLGDGVDVSIIDVPGHRRLVHTMIAGAVGMELVLLVVAADEGVMPQTREHVAACELLGLRRAVIVVTKTDRVDAELAELAGLEARELLGARFETEVVACSARTGEGIEAVRAAVRRQLLALGPARAAAHARLSVDRVFSVRGAGTVVTGTLVEGRLAVGASLFVVGPSGARAATARGLHLHDMAVEQADAPCRLAINLAQLAVEDVHRGDVVTTEAAAASTRRLDVTLRAAEAPGERTTATVYLGTSRALARVAPIGPFEGGHGLARLWLEQPLVAFGGDRFVLRGPDTQSPTGAVWGGGMVLDAHPPGQRPRAKRQAVLEALRERDTERAMLALVHEATPRPLLAASLEARFAVETRELLKAAGPLMSRHELAKIKASGWMAEAALLQLAGRVRRMVEQHQADNPLDRGLAVETLRQRLAKIAGAEAAEEIVRAAASRRPGIDGEPIIVDRDVARVAGAYELTGAARGAFEAAVRAVDAAGLRGVSEFAVRQATASSAKDARAILAKLVRDGLAFATGELWFARGAYVELRGRVEAHLAGAPRLTIAEFKELSGLGRKQAIVLLEQLDADGTTRREGDDRVPGARLLEAP
jgi:selenocysteine-specific elongation factor